LSMAEANYRTAMAAYAKAPTNAEAKANFVMAAASFGTANMMSETLDRKVKYKVALQYYREVLKVDPKNEEALKNKDLIEGIYKQMGRPIPE
jgi:hypothetical protein